MLDFGLGHPIQKDLWYNLLPIHENCLLCMLILSFLSPTERCKYVNLHSVSLVVVFLVFVPLLVLLLPQSGFPVVFLVGEAVQVFFDNCCYYLNLFVYVHVCYKHMITTLRELIFAGTYFRRFFFPEISREKMEFIFAVFRGFVGNGNFTRTYFRRYKELKNFAGIYFRGSKISKNKRVRRKGNWE